MPARDPHTSLASDAERVIAVGRRNFDTGVFREHLGEVPVGGFFCNGEIGPVGGATFLHGYTSSFGLFRPRDPA
jgi:small ligand-binding sensory domain FIST